MTENFPKQEPKIENDGREKLRWELGEASKSIETLLETIRNGRVNQVDIEYKLGQVGANIRNAQEALDHTK